MTHVLGLGDDGRVHWWRFVGSEELTRACDGVTAVNVELYARDKHGECGMCRACVKAKEAMTL